RTGGLPEDREIGAVPKSPREDTSPGGEREIGAAETCTVRMIGPAEVVQLLQAVLCTVRRRMEAAAGRLPTEGQALGVILDYVFSCWGAGKKVPAEHRVFERDGWLCRVPGCSSMQNLQDHHVIFRSRGGSDDLTNRVAVCAFHHLRGIHAQRIRCEGRAPDGLTWQIGIRPGAAPLATYTSGDRQVDESRC
ncbi:MAG TPA: HNH endonuclease signature motif containing protein, partial [Vicinamibacteria bacterium]